MQRVVIIDDEPLARKGLRRLLSRHPSFKIVGEADSGATGATLIRKEKPDAVFLDVEMPGSTGFEMLSELDPRPRVVIVTAHAEHAMHAFDIEAVDYLHKPVTPARFDQAIRRLQTHQQGSASLSDQPYSKTDKICLRTPERTIVAAINSIPLLLAEGDFTRFHFTEHPPLMICHPLGDYEAVLPSPPFLRIDRSHIINLDLIVRMNRSSRDEAVLILEGVPEGIPLARTAQQRLKRYLS
jgi:two-component system LytT family response regulator